MFKNFIAAVKRVRVADMLQPEPLQALLVEEVDLLRKERIRAVSKMHRAMCNVAYYDNLLDQLEGELQSGVRDNELYDDPRFDVAVPGRVG